MSQRSVKRSFGKAFSLLLCVAALATFNVCGGGGNADSGGGPTLPPIATPTPSSAPTAEPPISASCARIGMGDPKAKCRSDASTFLGDVEDAISTLKKERPEIFSDDVVLNVGAYYVGLIKVLDRKGLCAGTDGEEFGVKNNNDYSDVFDVLTAKNEIRRYYVGTCYPAIFPEPSAPVPPPPPGCNLPSSSLIACGRDGDGRYYDDMAAAIEQVLKQKPELFDFSDTVTGTDWPLAKDPAAYQNAVVSILTQKGYCALFDGEEITIKRTNELTEHYDINFQDKYVRKGKGIYRGSCYPAAF